MSLVRGCPPGRSWVPFHVKLLLKEGLEAVSSKLSWKALVVWSLEAACRRLGGLLWYICGVCIQPWDLGVPSRPEQVWQPDGMVGGRQRDELFIVSL